MADNDKNINLFLQSDDRTVSHCTSPTTKIQHARERVYSHRCDDVHTIIIIILYVRRRGQYNLLHTLKYTIVLLLDYNTWRLT